MFAEVFLFSNFKASGCARKRNWFQCVESGKIDKWCNLDFLYMEKSMECWQKEMKES